MSSKEEEAKQAIQDAKTMIEARKYEDAKTKIQEAINLLPTIQYGQQMITVCEILHLCQKHKYYCQRNRCWPYTLFQIPASSTKSVVKSRYEKLRADLRVLGGNFIGTAAAMKELDSAMSMYKDNYPNLDKKRKACSPSDEECTAASESDSGGDNGGDSGSCGGGDDDPYAARSTPELKKLRQHVFATLPQQPHFSPLAKYCASVRQEMRLGFDMIFVKLTQKLQNLGGDKILSREEEYTIRAELSNLEEMGYDVMKLRERFDLLVRVKSLAKEDESYEEKIKNLEAEISAVMVQLAKDQRRLSKLKSENEVVKAQHYIFKSEMACLKVKLGEGDLCNMVKIEAKD